MFFSFSFSFFVCLFFRRIFPFFSIFFLVFFFFYQSPLYNDGGVAHHKAQLNKFFPKPKAKQVQYLVPHSKHLEGNTANDEKVDGAEEADESDEDVVSTISIPIEYTPESGKEGGG